jgi:hypothetical protein
MASRSLTRSSVYRIRYRRVRRRLRYWIGPDPLAAPTLSFVYSTINAIRISWTAATGGHAPLAYDVYRDGVLLAANQVSPFDDSSVSVDTMYAYAVKVNDAVNGATATSNSVSCALPYDGAALGSGGGSRISGILTGGRL